MASSRVVEPNVELIELADRQIYLVGTAHVSQASADLADRIIRQVKPGAVAVELCESRYQAIRDPERWKNTDIVTVIRQGKAYVLLAQLMLAGFQKKLGKKFKVKPGAEMIAALDAAEAVGATVVLADRDVKITLKRAMSSLGFWTMCKLASGLVSSLFSSKDVSEEEIERLKSSDALSELMSQFTASFPKVQQSLIHERDLFICKQLQKSSAPVIVAIVGAGHVPGIKSAIDLQIDTSEIEKLPPPSKLGKYLSWALPILLGLMVLYGFFFIDTSRAMLMMEAWFWITAFFGALGAGIALAHPITILVTFFITPIATIHPLIASGWIAGLVEAWLRKPRVKDFEVLGDELLTVRGWWTNRVSRILLVVAFTNLLASLGMIIAVSEVASLVVN